MSHMLTSSVVSQMAGGWIAGTAPVGVLDPVMSLTSFYRTF